MHRYQPADDNPILNDKLLREQTEGGKVTPTILQPTTTPERQTTTPPGGGTPSPNPNVRPGQMLPGGPPYFWEDPDGTILIYNEETGQWEPYNPDPDPDEDPMDDEGDPELDEWQKGYNEFFTNQILQWIQNGGEEGTGRTIKDIIDIIDANYPPKPWRFRL